jgi:tetratricopeptide (TPR) repeat protein
MNQSLDKRIDELVEAALRRTPSERESFLAAACGQNRELLAKVRQRLDASASELKEVPTQTVDRESDHFAPVGFGSGSDVTWVGRSIGNYHITGHLGRGGMGEVYLARDTRLGREVALKFLPREAINDQSRLRRFFQEARAASTLNHPNIVTIYEVGELDGVPFIATELIQGRTLRHMMKEQLPVELTLRIGTQIAKALAVAHSSGIVHRDIKPENIMVRDDGYVKILDFGLARLAALPGTDFDSKAGTYVQTSAGIIVGTLAYMSPEQAQGDVVGSATDIFSLGVVLFELATGQHPFRSDSRVGLMNAIVTQHPVPPSRLNPETAGSLETTILRMLEKAPRDRPGALEVEESLSSIQFDTSALTQAVMVAKATPHTVGREPELSQLQSCFERASGGRGQIFCVAGEPGIGKTTLIEDFLAQLRARSDVGIARGRCSERLAGTEAYLPFIEAVESLLNEPGNTRAGLIRMLAPTWYGQVVSLSPDHSSDVAVLADIKSASQERLKREMANLLDESSRAKPLILFFDDLHWADDSTTSMLAYLANKFDGMRLMIIAAYRPSDLMLNKHPFLQVKLDLQTRGLCSEIQLGFLSREEVAHYISQEFQVNRFPEGLAQLIYAKTEGSPLFMADLVRYLRDQEIIAERNGEWVLTREMSAIESELPESVRSMIQRKIDQLDEEDRRLLVAASVQGYNFDSSVVARASGVESSQVEDRLENLERVHSFVRLIDEHEFPDRTITLRYQFVHVLYQNALYSTLKPTRRAALSAGVASALLSFYRERASVVALDLALLFETAREFPRAADFFVVAAQSALQVFAHPEAQALAQRGLKAIDGVPESDERNRKELMLQGMLASAATAIQTAASPIALEAYNRARDLCVLLGEDRMLFNVRFGLFWSHMARGESADAKAEAEALLELARKVDDESLLVEAHHLRGVVASHAGSFLEARDHLEQSVNGYKPDQKHSTVYLFSAGEGLVTRATLAHTLRILGYPDQAKQIADETRRLAVNSNYPLSRVIVLMASASLYRDFGGPTALLELAEELIGVANDFQTGQAPWGTLLRGSARAELGDDDGINEMRNSLFEQAKTGSRMLGPSYRLLFAGTLIKAGLIDEAEETMKQVLELARRINEGVSLAEMYRVMGELMVAKSEAVSGSVGAAVESDTLMQAESWFHRAIETARQQNAKLWELLSATSLSRLYMKQNRKDDARPILAGVYEWFSEGFNTESLRGARSLLDQME